MKIVSNTSPLVALEYLGDLGLLQKLFGYIWIPPAVRRELETRRLPDCFQVRALDHPLAPRIMRASLGAGESEALALAIEMDADFVLLDDKAARRLASTLGQTPLGTLDLLLRAKRAGLISAIRPKLSALQSLPFHIAPQLYEAVLRAGHEWPDAH